MRGNELIIEAQVENVCVSLDGKPRRLPAELVQKMATYLPGAAPLRPQNHPPANDVGAPVVERERAVG